MNIRLLIIDDSASERRMLPALLSNDPEIDVIGAVADALSGRDMIVRHEPDVVLLDLELRKINSITFLRRVMEHHPMPILAVAPHNEKGGQMALEALSAGAVAVITKPDGALTLVDIAPEIIEKVKAARFVRVSKPVALMEAGDREHRPELAMHKIVAIGASTGGTQALEAVLARMPTNLPGTVIVQHMPEPFTLPFAKRLDDITPYEVKEAQDGDIVKPGLVLIAPGNKHMVLRKFGAIYSVGIINTDRVNRHRPSVDVLFDSVAKAAGRNAVGAILTGMGDDGARGLLRMRQSGAATLAQDEKTSIVFGMPKEAIQRGAAQQIVPLERVAETIVRLCTVKAPVEETHASTCR